jgi:hypothetical protein
MWHILYIIAFAVLAALAITNLVRNLILLGSSARQGSNGPSFGAGQRSQNESRPVPHPELLDQDGNVIREPLLVMRSISVKDAREQLDELYGGGSQGADEQDDAGLDKDG